MSRWWQRTKTVLLRWSSSSWLVRIVLLYAVMYLFKFWITIISGPRYVKDQQIRLYANRIGTRALPSINFPYQHLPFCDSHQSPVLPLSLRQVLAGDRPTFLPSYTKNLTFHNNLPHVQVACSQQFHTVQLQQLQTLIRQRAVIEYYIDDLPLRMYIGTVGDQGWYDFAKDQQCDQVVPDNDDTTPLYLLPHAHFILGHFGDDRLTSARLVTDFAREVDISNATTLTVNFTYSVEWRKEKFLEYPGRHFRYFRIYLFFAEWLKEQHKDTAAHWGKFTLMSIILALARYLYLCGGKTKHYTSRKISVAEELANWPPNLGMHRLWNVTLLLGLQFNVIILMQCVLIWLRLVAPMVRGSLWQSTLISFLFTCPLTGYVCRHHSVVWWHIPTVVLCLTGCVWLLTQSSLPRSCTGIFPLWAAVLIIPGMGVASLLLFCMGAQHYSIAAIHLHRPSDSSHKTPFANVGTDNSWIELAPFLFWGFLPFYFWSEHSAYMMECLYGRQFYVNANLLRNTLVYTALLLASGNIGIHLILSPANMVNDPNTAYSQQSAQLQKSFLSGAMVGLGLFLQSFYYYYEKSCIPGYDTTGAQSVIFFGHTALICIGFSAMFGSSTTCALFAWQRHGEQLAQRLRFRVDDTRRRMKIYALQTKAWVQARLEQRSQGTNQRRMLSKRAPPGTVSVAMAFLLAGTTCLFCPVKVESFVPLVSKQQALSIRTSGTFCPLQRRAAHRYKTTLWLHMTTSFNSDEDSVMDPRFIQRNKYWVVIVDDEEAIRLPVGDYLYDEGYQVTACADAAALLEDVLPKQAASPSPRLPDAIVSDIRMPEMDGLELLAKIRENPSWARIPVILLTAKGLTSDRVTGYKAGADAYLTKPFDPEELLSMLDNLILRRQQLQQQGPSGLTDLQKDLSSIKQMMQENTKKVVKSTPVFLSNAERAVLEGVCKGQTNAEISSSVDMSTDKVSRTLTTLYQLTECQTRTELVRWAFDTGYASPYS